MTAKAHIHSMLVTKVSIGSKTLQNHCVMKMLTVFKSVTWKKALFFNLIFWRTIEISLNSIFRIFELFTHEHLGNCSVNISPEHFVPWNYQILGISFSLLSWCVGGTGTLPTQLELHFFFFLVKFIF